MFHELPILIPVSRRCFYGTEGFNEKQLIVFVIKIHLVGSSSWDDKIVAIAEINFTIHGP